MAFWSCLSRQTRNTAGNASSAGTKTPLFIGRNNHRRTREEKALNTTLRRDKKTPFSSGKRSGRSKFPPEERVVSGGRMCVTHSMAKDTQRTGTRGDG